MKCILGSRGYSVFAGYATAYSQNYKKGKVSIILETKRELTAGDIQDREVFEVSNALAKKLVKERDSRDSEAEDEKEGKQ